MAHELYAACENGDLGKVRRLLAGVSFEDLSMLTDGFLEYYPLHAACNHDNVELVDVLCKKGTNVNRKNAACDSPLHFAAFAGSSGVVGKLIDYGADVNIRNDKNGNTPLHVLTSTAVPTAGLPDMLNTKSYFALCRLLEAGASLQRNNKNYTPLDQAADQENVGVIKRLLQDNHFCYVEGNVSTLKEALLRHDDNTAVRLATVLLENSYPRTLGFSLLAEVVVDTQRAGQDLGLVLRRIKRLFQTPESPDLFPGGFDALLDATIPLQNVSVDVVRLLIDEGASVNALNSQRFPLRRACACNNLQVVDLLLSCGADVDETLGGASLPLLHSAVLCQQSDLVTKLLDKRADVNLQYKGYTPLHAAYSIGCLDLIQTLVSSGADPRIRDNDGKMAFQLLKLTH